MTSNHLEYDAAIGRIYKAALGEGAWEEAIDSILSLTGYDGAAFYAWDRGEEAFGGQKLRHGLWYNLATDTQSDYENHYFKIDPRVEFLIANPKARILHDYLHTSESEIARSEYYGWYQKAQPTKYYLGGRTTASAPVELGVTLHRRASRGAAESNEIALFDALFTHLERAALVEYRLGLADAQSAADFEHNETAIVLLRADGSVLHANAAARAIAASNDGIVIESSGVRSGLPSDNAALKKIVARAVREGVASPALRLSRKSGREDYMAMVTPVPNSTTLFSALRPAVCLLITDPVARISPPETALRRLFGLTAMQASVASALVSGLSVDEVAQHLSISRHTVRVHLAQILKKTETSRQAELVRLLMNVPWRTLSRMNED
ncbi:MAG TPA: helix-turn-helix transcriptional regulator [Rhizomicrobium sp.]|nr:helix-turn-helix transcriptional regulator [Rhizomicrobium sp.]